MSLSRDAYRTEAVKLIRAGTSLIARGITRGPAVDDWERMAMNVLLELDQEQYESQRIKLGVAFEAAIGHAIFGKKDRIRNLIQALEKARQPAPGIPIEEWEGYRPRRR